MWIRVFFFLSLFSCSSETNQTKATADESKLKVRHTVEYNFKQENDFQAIIKVLEGFFNTQNNSYASNPYWFENDNSFFTYPFFEISTLERYGNSTLSKNLLSITQTSPQHFICKIGWFHEDQNEASLQFIYNVSVIKIGESYLLKNIVEYNIKDWEKIRQDRITYWTPANHKIDQVKAKKFNAINEQLSTFFNAEILDFSYVLCKSNAELMRLIGYDFEQSMYFSNQNGSVTYPDDFLIFSGNNDEINTHELVHLYVAERFTRINPFMNEGLATLLGGSKGVDYREHLLKLKNHLMNNDIDIYEEYFFKNYVIDNETSLRYTLSAFLCDLVLNENDKAELFELINCGNSNQDLMNYIAKVFNVNSINFNEYIINELEAYDFDSEFLPLSED